MSLFRIKFRYVGSPEIYEREWDVRSKEAARKKLMSMDWHKPIEIVDIIDMSRLGLRNRKWTKEQDTFGEIVWRHKNKQNVTVEAHTTYNKDSDDYLTWYVYGAVGGTAVQSAPRTVKGKAGAIRIIASLKKTYEKNGIEGWGGKYRD